MVATGVSARGMDIAWVMHVINCDLLNVNDARVHSHHGCHKGLCPRYGYRLGNARDQLRLAHHQRRTGELPSWSPPVDNAGTPSSSRHISSPLHSRTMMSAQTRRTLSLAGASTVRTFQRRMGFCKEPYSPRIESRCSLACPHGNFCTITCAMPCDRLPSERWLPCETRWEKELACSHHCKCCSPILNLEQICPLTSVCQARRYVKRRTRMLATVKPVHQKKRNSY